MAITVSGAIGFIAWIIFAPLLFLFYAICLRVTLEMVIVIYRILENTQELVQQKKQRP